MGIKSYGLLLKAVAPFNEKAKLFTEGRKDIWDKIETFVAKNDAPIAWFHSASLGEFEQGRPVIEAYKKEYPNHKIVLTFFSPSGYEVRKNYKEADLIIYLPLDTEQNAKRFITTLKPTIAYFIKYEFWHHYLSALKRNNIPVISISAIFREDQPFFKKYGEFNREILRNFRHIFVQDQKSLDLLKSIQINNSSIGFDTRFDRVQEIYEQRKDLPIPQKFSEGSKCLVLGSSWKSDLDVIYTTLTELIKSKNLKLIIAPHEIGESSILETEKAFEGAKIIRFSNATTENVVDKDILIIDNIGMLSSLYQYGDFAYIGGAFGSGLHNTLEAATYGIPVLFGSKYSKFKEARDLVELEGAFSCQDEKDFKSKFYKLLNDDELRVKCGNTAKKYVEENTGGTALAIQLTKEILGE